MRALHALLFLAGLSLALGCGASVDRQATLDRLRTAMTEEVPQEPPTVLQEHNQLVEDARNGNIFDQMRRSEVEAALGRGQECGSRELCARHGFSATAWVYEIGRREGVAWGPTIIIGFDRQGIVDNVYTLVRR